MMPALKSKISNVPSCKYLLVFAAAFFACFCVHAFIVGPYTVDTNTLHLWHLDETAVPAIDSAPGGTNLIALHASASLGNASLTGFGNCLSTAGSGQSYLAPLVWTGTTADDENMVYANTNTGAFTYEAIIRINFNPAASGQPAMYIMSCENNAGNRPWQWGLFPIGVASGATGDDTTKVRLRFYAGGSAAPDNIIVFVPSTGPDAIAQGNWYHVAVTFSGGASGQLLQYWTLMSASRGQTSLLSGPSTTMNALVPLATGSVNFQIGNEGRNSTALGFNGDIDEVRISNIARAATNMMFYSFAVVISQGPVSQSLAVGQPANFSVTASGSPPLSYQWRTNGIAIPAATNSTYYLLSPQLSDAASYDVVVTNSTSAATSAVATLTMRLPLNLTWLGSASLTWDTNTVNWDTNADDVADSVYTFGDNVRFDDNGSANPIIDVSGIFTPSSVVVSNIDVNYYLGSGEGGGIAGSCGLTKQGSGSLILDIINAYAGPTIIQNGTLTVGNGDTSGSLGTGPVTNLGVLAFNRTDTFTITNDIDGSGSLIQDGTGSLSLMGSNTLSGLIAVNDGDITVGPAGLGNCTNIVMTASGGGGGTSFTLSGGTVVGANVSFLGITSGGDSGNRVNIHNASGSNTWNGPISLAGNAPAVIFVIAGSLEVNGPTTGPDYADYLTLRGAGNGILAGTVTLPNGGLQKTDGDTWVVNSTNNSYLSFRMDGGTLQLGNNDALAVDGYLISAGGIVDLAGFNQTVSGLADYTSGTTTIANSSTNSDSRLTIATAPTDSPWTCGCIIADSTAGGTHRVSLTLTGGATLAFSNVHTYSGDTTISGGTLALRGSGALLNSSPINLAAGTTLDASARSDGTLTIWPAQVLKGDGAFNVVGSLSNEGTIELKLNKAGATLSNDSINGLTAVSYGGTLQLDVTASPALATSDSFKLFSATSYNGAFPSISPSLPSFGLAWDTSTLATDGTLRIKQGPATNPTNITAVVVGGGSSLQIAWPSDHLGWSLQMQTNAAGAGLSTNWFIVPGSDTATQVVIPLNPANGSVFYRLVYP
jgi:autotransporter-associated beta strand protein